MAKYMSPLMIESDEPLPSEVEAQEWELIQADTAYTHLTIGCPQRRKGLEILWARAHREKINEALRPDFPALEDFYLSRYFSSNEGNNHRKVW